MARNKFKKNKSKVGLMKRGSLGFRRASFAVVALVVAVCGYTAVSRSHASSCTISAELVNSCRPWIGAAVAGYPQVASDNKSQVLYHEQRIGHQLDVVHEYNGVGDDTLSADAVYFATRANTYLYQNWKGPTASWGDVENQNAGIDQMAASIKSLGSKKIFLTYWHEPENDVSPGGDSNCPNLPYKGSAGTVAQYKAAWAYIEGRFNTDGVTNVVWVMNYMGYSVWDCLVPDMWPGNDLVDWVTMDSYSSGDSSTWANTVGRIYDVLQNDNSTTDNFESKPWGAAEWGDCDTSDQAHVYQYYGEAKAALDANSYPRLKMYMVYDDNGNNAGMGCLTEYSKAGTFDPTEQSDYNAFADDMNFTGSAPVSTPTPTPTPVPTHTVAPTPIPTHTVNPTTTPSTTKQPPIGTSPSPSPPPKTVVVGSSGSASPPTVSGNITITPASIPAGATSVQYLVDGKTVPTGAVNTDNLSNGTHTIETKVTLASGKTQTQKSTIVVNNHQPVSKLLIAAFTRNARGEAATVVLILICASGGWYLNKRFKLWSILRSRYFKIH